MTTHHLCDIILFNSKRGGGRIKIGIFTDSHYSSADVTCGRRYNNQSLRKITEAYDFFEKENCSLVVCLGDLIDTESSVEKEILNLREISKIIQKSAIPTVCLMGNHDAFVLERERFYEIIAIPAVEELSIDGRRLLFLDACYFKNGCHYSPGDTDWTDCFLPNENILKDKLSGITEDTYIFIHQNIDPAVAHDHRLFNADKIFRFINKSKAVKCVFQGHYHPGCDSEYNGVRYLTLPAMCEKENAFSVYDI